VREALIERETLLRAMPHISWPMRFVLPYRPTCASTETPTSRLLSRIMPWMKGRRPAWLIRLGLFLYDHLGGRKILPGTRRSLDLRKTPRGRAAAGPVRAGPSSIPIAGSRIRGSWC
jgi:glycerol-3-phosphate dehydrogenase